MAQQRKASVSIHSLMGAVISTASTAHSKLVMYTLGLLAQSDFIFDFSFLPLIKTNTEQ